VNCDRIARWYRWLEYAGFGGALQRRRVAFLKDLTDARRVLVLGDGDGRFLARLVEQTPAASIDYVDLSGKMLALAKERAGAERVCYRQGDALKIPLAEGEYDLVCTHFFFDCLSDKDAAILVDRVAPALRREARWVISEFREAGWLGSIIVSGLYFFFQATTGLRTRRLVDHRALLSRRGFRLVKEDRGAFGLVASELWASAGFEDISGTAC